VPVHPYAVLPCHEPGAMKSINSLPVSFSSFTNDDHSGLVQCNASQILEEQNRQRAGFLKKEETQVDNTLPGKILVCRDTEPTDTKWDNVRLKALDKEE